MSSLSRRTVLSAPPLLLLRQDEQARLSLGRKVKLALIGLEGHPSEILDPLPLVDGLTLAAVSHPADGRARQWAAGGGRRGVQAYTDWRRMLDAEKPDAVAICNENGPRAEATIECLTRSLPVISEKPLALRQADLDRIRSLVQARKVHLSCLLKMRTDPWYLAIRELVRSGALGEVVQVAAQKSYKYEGQDDWKKRRDTFGATIPWIGIDLIDLMRFAGGREFSSVAALHTHIGLPELGTMENSAACLFRLDNGGMADLRLDYLRTSGAPTHGDDRLRVAGTLGIAEYQAATGVTLQIKGEKPRAVEQLPPRRWILFDFLSAAFLGREPETPVSEVLRSNQVALGAWRAAETGAWVKL
jgi:predicted dehydrogenase